jgi:ribosomal-protein-alanine N-acetyltransferase
MTAVSTERLLLRPLEWADREAYAAFRFHPEVAQWLSPADRDPLAASEATIARFQSSWSTRGYAPWGVFRDGKLIGQCGLNFVPEFGKTEVLWALHPAAWGQGYATEAARAALAFGFETIGLDLIFAVTKPDNLASQAVMKRLGLIYRREVVYRDIPSVWFDKAKSL